MPADRQSSLQPAHRRRPSRPHVSTASWPAANRSVGLARSAGILAALSLSSLALAADVTRPAQPGRLIVTKSGTNLTLQWTAVTTDAAGQPETVAHYNVYRGTSPSFVPDRVGGSNRIGTPAGPSYIDTGAAGNTTNYYYLVSAVDS